MHQLLALPYIEKGTQTAAFAVSDEGQRVLAYGQRPTRDLELDVEPEQVEIRACHVAHESRDDGLTVVLAGEQVGAGSLSRAPQPSPHVDLVREEIESDDAKRPRLVDVLGQWNRSARRTAHSRQARTRLDRRQLVGSGDAEVGASGLDSHHGVADIVVAHECGAHHLLELLVLEDREPLQVRQRGRVAGWRVGAAKDGGRRDRGPAIVRAHRAPGEQSCSHDGRDGETSHRSTLTNAATFRPATAGTRPNGRDRPLRSLLVPAPVRQSACARGACRSTAPRTG